MFGLLLALSVQAAPISEEYLVVDLSAGPKASSYPVSTLAAAPAGGWADEYKTTKMVLRKIPAGFFTMGSPANELGRDSDETQHQVTLTKDFYVGVFEVTRAQWEAVMGSNPSTFTGANLPVEKVSWEDCQEFIEKLNSKGVGTFRLPTEAEWEYACRAGTTTAFHYGDSLDASMANFDGDYPYGEGKKGEDRQTTIAVGQFKPNAWGLYDMHGNVWEWCLDWYGDYSQDKQIDPRGAAGGSDRVLRGGSWDHDAGCCRSAYRDWSWPSGRGHDLGFRLVRMVP